MLAACYVFFRAVTTGERGEKSLGGEKWREKNSICALFSTMHHRTFVGGAGALSAARSRRMEERKRKIRLVASFKILIEEVRALLI